MRHGSAPLVVAPDGVLRIAEAIKASCAGKLEIATKELYREGGKKDGVLARGKHGFLRVVPPSMVPKLDDSRQDVQHSRTPTVGDDDGLCWHHRSPSATGSSRRHQAAHD